MAPTIAELTKEATSARTPASTLAELASSRHERVRFAVAANPHTPPDVVAALVADRSPLVRGAAVANLELPVSVDNRVAFSGDGELRLVLAGKYADSERDLSRSAQEHLARDEKADVRAVVARTTNFLHLFDALMVDPVDRVRAGCAQNPRITESAAFSLARDRAMEVRFCIASIPYGPIPNEAELRRLASDKSVDVRWAVAVRTNVSEEILKELEGDSHVDVRHQASGSLRRISALTPEKRRRYAYDHIPRYWGLPFD
jgi:hypothetical protein